MIASVVVSAWDGMTGRQGDEHVGRQRNPMSTFTDPGASQLCFPSPRHNYAVRHGAVAVTGCRVRQLALEKGFRRGGHATPCLPRMRAFPPFFTPIG
eukprot:jgi/Mesvir1/23961/Mv25236-RA.1